ncbi:hypothetical protein [Aurantiacibacter rhizosphaerae]|uniref:Uncharacterized protein n=1 Tax=Aurantiacibacter rhizosphaerae TaxID=2691582 RepID=A0A844XE30_9SPHN|nr:hypothetical protein [Aurantiacibacter rhizosphaerae]MWV27838.1 hypothetical protein [Aurantiacibacter rhizosphaerae]
MKFKSLFALAAAFSLSATPAVAQEQEEPRTTYRVTMVDLADGADERWNEIYTTMVVPAREAAGLSPETVHWVMMNPDYDLIIVSEMPRGLAAFDTHANAERDAFYAQMQTIAGGEAQLKALGEEINGLIEKRTELYTHTHP